MVKTDVTFVRVLVKVGMVKIAIFVEVKEKLVWLSVALVKAKEEF